MSEATEGHTLTDRDDIQLAEGLKATRDAILADRTRWLSRSC